MTTIEKFAKAVRKTLWPIGAHNHTEYHAWNDRVAELKKEKGYTTPQAQVQAAKEQPACLTLFEHYDVADYDPEPGSHDDAEACMQRKRDNRVQEAGNVQNEEIDQSHRDNLTWAMEAAGRFRRTGEEPASCPNDSAYFLYRRAIEEPKEFLARINQLELKKTVDSGEAKAARKSIEELSLMLESLTEEEEEHGE